MLRFPCSTQSYTDIEGSGGNFNLSSSPEALADFFTFAGVDYIYLGSGYLKPGTDGFRNVTGLLKQGYIMDLLYENGVVHGTGNGTYSPGQQITRGDYVLMLCQAFQLSGQGKAGFWDVPRDSYYAQAVMTAQALGITGGYPDGGFHPGSPVTRQDAAVFLMKAMQADGWSLGSGNEQMLSRFRDESSISAYARSAMAVMVEYGVLSGTADQTISPQKAITRAEMAVMLANALTL